MARKSYEGMEYVKVDLVWLLSIIRTEWQLGSGGREDVHHQLGIVVRFHRYGSTAASASLLTL